MVRISTHLGPIYFIRNLCGREMSRWHLPKNLQKPIRCRENLLAMIIVILLMRIIRKSTKPKTLWD